MRNRPVILAIFVLSGAAALIDEIVWSRQLVLVFGNTTQAVSAILAGFFGGIAIGSFVGGRIADRVRVPLRMYGFLELVLAVVVVLTPLSFRLINGLYRASTRPSRARPSSSPWRGSCSRSSRLRPATVLMGATLPTLTRQFARDVSLAGAFSRLYAANTIGAIVGTLLAGLRPHRDARPVRGARGGCRLLGHRGALGASPCGANARATGTDPRL